MDTDEALEMCRTIAHTTEKAIASLGLEEAGMEVGMGADGTPTKRIDEVAERTILNVLEAGGYSVRVVSEEAGEVVIGDASATLALDPIDGTTNATRGLPSYAVSIALASRALSDVWFGYVYDLSRGEEYHASRGEGAYSGGRRLTASRTTDLSEGMLTLYGFRQSPELMCRLALACKRLRMVGCASLELCHVASGGMEGYVDLRGKLRTIDVAAGILIAQEAGAVVTDEDGRPLNDTIDLSPKLRVVAACPPVHTQLMEIIHEVRA
ncbi:MAG: inositol monophosphatase family protein [Methermicoccaceae archaeon]